MPRQPATVTIDIETLQGLRALRRRLPAARARDVGRAVNGKGYRYPLLLDGCTGCELCAKVCPDFCFEVYREPAADEAAAS